MRHGDDWYFAMIVDFGIAKLLDAFAGKDGLTRTHAVLGTAGSMAPEQARGDRNIDARADVFAVGNMMYRMLTGRTRYPETSLYALIENQLKNVPFPRPRQLRPDLAQGVEDVIMAALAFDPKSRLGSMKDLAQGLAQCVPSGHKMLDMLAPGLAMDGKLGPAEATLTGDIEDSLVRLQSTQPAAAKRKTAYIAVSAALFGAAAVGGVVATKAMHGSKNAVSEAGSDHGSPSLSLAGAGSAPVAATQAAIAPVVIDAGIAVTPMDAPAASPPLLDAAVQHVAQAPVDSGSVAKHSEPAPHVVHPRPDPASATQQSKTGTLLVKVMPYAEVYIDNESVGTTPRRETLAVGPHHVKLVGADKTEELDVKVDPGKETTISRNW